MASRRVATSFWQGVMCPSKATLFKRDQSQKRPISQETHFERAIDLTNNGRVFLARSPVPHANEWQNTYDGVMLHIWVKRCICVTPPPPLFCAPNLQQLVSFSRHEQWRIWGKQLKRIFPKRRGGVEDSGMTSRTMATCLGNGSRYSFGQSLSSWHWVFLALFFGNVSCLSFWQGDSLCFDEMHHVTYKYVTSNMILIFGSHSFWQRVLYLFLTVSLPLL